MNNTKQHTSVFSYGHKRIPFCYWSNIRRGKKPDVIVFLGAGQVGKIPYWVAERAGPGVVVVAGLPSWESDTAEEKVMDFTKRYALNALRVVHKHFGLQATHVLAESQAAPGILFVAHTLPRRVHNLCLIRPLGFSAAAFGSTTDERLRSFRRRLRRGWLQLPQALLHDPRNLTASLIAMRSLRKDPPNAFNQKFGVGISYDGIDDCRMAADKLHKQGGTFTILLGKKDRLFTVSEVSGTLEEAHIPYINTVVVPRSPHASLATRTSSTILHQALLTLRKNHTA